MVENYVNVNGDYVDVNDDHVRVNDDYVDVVDDYVDVNRDRVVVIDDYVNVVDHHVDMNRDYVNVYRKSVMQSRFARLVIGITVVSGMTTRMAWASDGEQRPATLGEAREVGQLQSASYTTEILIAHAAPLSVMWATAIVSDGKSNGAYFTAFGLTLPPLILTPPIVHAWHEEWGRSAASLGINFVAAIPGWATMWIFVLEPCEERGTRCGEHKFKKTAAVHTFFSGLATLADIAMADVGPSDSKTRVEKAGIQGDVISVPGGLMLGARGVF